MITAKTPRTPSFKISWRSRCPGGKKSHKCGVEHLRPVQLARRAYEQIEQPKAKNLLNPLNLLTKNISGIDQGQAIAQVGPYISWQ